MDCSPEHFVARVGLRNPFSQGLCTKFTKSRQSGAANLCVTTICARFFCVAASHFTTRLLLITAAVACATAQEPAPATAPPTAPVVAPTSPTPTAPGKPATPGVPAVGIAPPGTIGGLPDNTVVLSQKAAVAFGEQKWDEARAAYQEMLKLDDQNALAWANLGAVEQQAGRPKEALECFEKSVRINPTVGQSWNALGLIYSAQGDTYRAISCFTRAIHEEPTDARAHNYLAIAAKNLGWIDAAQTELQRAIELNPQYGIAHFNLALLYLDQKPPATELAKRHYEKAVALGVEKDEIVERRLKE